MVWIIISWVMVAILTAINIFVFLKLKKASEQMMKAAFPNAKNMNDAVSQMQGMMGKGGMPNMGNLQQMMSQMDSKDMQSQMKMAMDMLSQMQKNQRR